VSKVPCHQTIGNLQVAISGSQVFIEHSHKSGRLSESTCLVGAVKMQLQGESRHN